MPERNYENWYIRSQNGLPGPFWPLFRPKLVKIDQNHYFLASDAKLFPTRSHMPMFEPNYENWYILSQNGLLGPFWPLFRPKLFKMIKVIIFLLLMLRGVTCPSLFNLD